MSYVDVGPSLLSDSTSVGAIPYDIILRNMESSNVLENPDGTNEYIRGLLMDFRPDKPFFESDQVREDPHSKEKLSIRYNGARSDATPKLPDGTFLDYEFAQRDPRGVMPTADMRRYRQQMVDRGPLIKLSNDNDYSVPESNINPSANVANRIKNFERYKSNYKNFDESMGGMQKSKFRKDQIYAGSTVAKQTSDGVLLDISEAGQINRADAVTKLSNDPTIAFRHSTTDHRFKIAKYGLVRVSQDQKKQDWGNTMRSTHTDHAIMDLVDGTLVNRGLSVLISDLEGRRFNMQEVAKGSTYGESTNNFQANKKLNPEDIYKILHIGGRQSHSANSNELLEGSLIIRSGDKPMNDNRKLLNNVEFNHEIINLIEQSNKYTNDHKIKDLREQIVESAGDYGLYNEATNRSMKENMKSNNQSRHQLQSQAKLDGFTVKSYSGFKPTYDNRQKNINYEDFKSHSLNSMMKDKRNTMGNKSVDDVENDMIQGNFEFGSYGYAPKSINSYTVRNYSNSLERSDESDTITDTTSSLY